jgi:hypothetical protein
MSKQKRLYGEKALEDITSVVQNYHLLLDQFPADNVPNAIKVIKTFRENISELYKQNQEMMQALECDNWKNAVTRAKRLMAKENLFDPEPTPDRG